MSRFEAVLFDLDGTLIDSGSLVARSAIATFKHFGFPEPTPEDVIAYMGIPLEVYFPKLAGPTYRDHNPADILNDYRVRFKALVESGALTTFDGIPAILKTLKARGVKTAVATSKTTEPAIHSCQYAGILPYLDVIVGSDLVAAYKPAPDTALLCLEKLQMNAGTHVCVVGDAEADMAMGRDAGTITCGVTWGAHDETRLLNQKPDHIAHNIDALERFLGIIS